LGLGLTETFYLFALILGELFPNLGGKCKIVSFSYIFVCMKSKTFSIEKNLKIILQKLGNINNLVNNFGSKENLFAFILQSYAIFAFIFQL